MSAWAIRLAATAVSLVGLLAVAMVPSQAQSLDELHVQAKAEGGLVLYVGGPTAPWEARAKQFEKRYSGIKVSITGGFSNVLDKQIDQQLKENKSASLERVSRQQGRSVHTKRSLFSRPNIVAPQLVP